MNPFLADAVARPCPDPGKRPWQVARLGLASVHARATRRFIRRAGAIAIAADRIRAPEAPFRYMLELIEIKDEAIIAQQTLDVAMRISKPTAERQGDAKALVRFVEPRKDQGKALLANLDKLWFYDPRLRRPIPIARQQRLIGQVANGDIVAADFDLSYASAIVDTEPCGEVQCYKLALERRWQFVTYPRITYWVEVESKRPYKAEFLSTGGLVMKTAWYKDYRPALGQVRPHEIVIVDTLQKNHYTQSFRLVIPHSRVRSDVLLTRSPLVSIPKDLLPFDLHV